MRATNQLNLLNRFPFIRILFPFIAGIFICEYLYISHLVIIISVILLFICSVVINIFINYNVQWIWGIFATLYIFFSGYGFTQIHLEKSDQLSLPENKIIMEGYIRNRPVKKSKTFQTTLIGTVPGSQIKKLKMLVYMKKDSICENLQAGDRIKITIVPEKIKNNGNPGEFNYKRYMAIKGIYYFCFIDPKNIILCNRKTKNVFTIAENLRSVFLKKINTYIPDQEKYAVASSLVLGYKEDLSPETKMMFSSSGAQHILSVSGLHVGIIYLFLLYILSPLKKISPVLQLILIMILLWIYAMITGLSPSVIRATTMFCLFSIGKLFKKHSDGLNILAFTALLFLVFNPLQLYNIGFQLSFLAMGSLLFFYPYIYSWYEAPNFILHELWKITALSLSAQAGIVPVILLQFHQFPVYFLLTNYVVIYLASVIVMSGFLLLIFSNTLFAGIFGWILSISEEVLLFIVKFIDSLPFSTINQININAFQSFLLYILLIFIVLFFLLKRNNHFKSLLFVLIILMGSFAYTKTKHLNQYKIIVLNERGKMLCDFIHGETSTVISNRLPDEHTTNLIEQCHLINRIKTTKIIHADTTNFTNDHLRYNHTGLIHFSGIDMLWIDSKYQEKRLLQLKEIPLNFIIVSGNIFFNPSDIPLSYGKIIVTSGNNRWIQKKWEEIQMKNPKLVHIVNNDGPFIIDI